MNKKNESANGFRNSTGKSIKQKNRIGHVNKVDENFFMGDFERTMFCL